MVQWSEAWALETVCLDPAKAGAASNLTSASSPVAATPSSSFPICKMGAAGVWAHRGWVQRSCWHMEGLNKGVVLFKCGCFFDLHVSDVGQG